MIRGLVQGVGFRPFIYRTALKYRLCGEVDNRNDGVLITVISNRPTIDLFCNDIKAHAPPASDIRSIDISEKMIPEYESFSIAASKITDDRVTEVSPDIAVCNECLDDLEKDPVRIDYPLVNCTNCGPRFTITGDLPYDRHNTSMRNFQMCRECEVQYNNINDRRFHAQPVACNNCGPEYTLIDDVHRLTAIRSILREVSILINSGKTIALKGMGGYHLMCDALNEEAVRTLRFKKQRDSKPFAVMFRDLKTLEQYCFLDEEEKKELTSWRRPIILLKQKKELAPSVNSGLTSTGAMLPYMPFHYMIFRELKTPVVVLTSGNISEEPVITDDSRAIRDLGKIADAIVLYNREIINRADDSVLRISGMKPSIIRRSRGYVPRPVYLPWDAEGILALGAEQKNTFCLGKGNQAVMAQYIGDITNKATYDFFLESLERFRKLFRFTPSLIACDRHPDYLSSQYANELCKQLNIPLVRVQHHHAHIASCMAENGIDEPVIGVSLDGTGLGSDNTIWGGEFLIATLKDFSRYTYFDPIPLPGGDRAVKEPWRIACSYLLRYFGNKFDFMSVPSLRGIGENKIRAVSEMLEANVNSPISSGAGRLFDAVSALLGLCLYESFDSEAPMRLESVIEGVNEEYYPFDIEKQVIFGNTFKAILGDLDVKPASFISAKFHNTIARIILDVSLQIRKENSFNKVILSGGVFQNKYLLEKSLYLLTRNGFEIFTNRLVPPNDGGVSLGQLVVALKTNMQCA